MKLAEGLALRADIQKRIQRLRERLALSALVQESDEPPENPQELLAELDRLFEQLRDFIQRINRTNINASLESGVTLTNALARRDVLKLRYGILQEVAKAASTTNSGRYSASEIRLIATVDVAALRRQADEVAQEYRELDTAIQEANWTTELQD